MELKSRNEPANRATRWTPLLVWSAIGSTVGSAVPCGYCMGVINAPAVHMRSWCQQTLLANYGVSLSDATLDTLWALIVAIYLIGGVFGSACAGWAANRFGRRGCFLLSGVLLLLGSFMFVSCRWLHSVELLLIGRIVVGLGGGLVSTCLPMYHSEIAAISQRGTLGVGCAVGFSVGLVISQIFTLESVFGGEETWHYGLSSYIIFMAICYAPFCYYAESPKWLYIVKQRRDEARQMLIHLRGTDYGIDQEIDAMAAEASHKVTTRGLGDVVTDPKLMLPLLLLCSYQGGQQLSGCSAIFYYSVSIFRNGGLSSSTAAVMSLCAGNVNLAISLMSPLLMAKFNRRTLMLMSSGFCGLVMFSFAWMVEYTDKVPWFSYGTMACIFLYLIAFQLALGPMPSFIGAELFEVPSRSVALSIGNQVGWGCNFVVGFLFPSMHSWLGSWVFLVFSMFAGLVFVLTKLYLPETRGVEVTTVADLVSKGFRSKVIK
ncbi:solute carrier family 2, facilitated glucose transporter member 1-like [Drosophila tropicalis]|uniref:solute carrier family 2, facilitated glucose transporter member 1-like n=1 Tax=Drosophila tropicalis TaxID=46794 RepID=UPI0035ABBDD5